MPLRKYKVTFKDGTSEMIQADSLDQAWKKARRSARQQISVGRMGRKQVDDVTPGEVGTQQGVRQFIPGGYVEHNPANRCMMRGESRGGQTRYCQFTRGHKGEHSYANEGT